jgi:hypothetical protein
MKQTSDSMPSGSRSNNELVQEETLTGIDDHILRYEVEVGIIMKCFLDCYES